VRDASALRGAAGAELRLQLHADEAAASRRRFGREVEAGAYTRSLSAQRKRFLWDRGRVWVVQGVFWGWLGVFWGWYGVVGNAQGVVLCQRRLNLS